MHGRKMNIFAEGAINGPYPILFFYKIKTWKFKNGWLKINSKFKMQWISHNIGLSAIMIVIKIEKHAAT